MELCPHRKVRGANKVRLRHCIDSQAPNGSEYESILLIFYQLKCHDLLRSSSLQFRPIWLSGWVKLFQWFYCEDHRRTPLEAAGIEITTINFTPLSNR
jgi:hypothetical protein